MFTFSSITNGIWELFTKTDNTFLFCSVKFWTLFVVFFAIYLLIRNRRKTMMLTYVLCFGLLISYKVNGWYMLLMPATALLSWYMTEMMKTAGGGKHAKRWLAAVIIVDLLPLIYFKYTNFLVGIFDNIFATNFSPMAIFLPVGLSFYTFQAISYSVDVYKQKVNYDVSLLEYCFYITFFPLLFAGPITRTDTLISQLRNDKPVDEKLVNLGFWLIILGLLKKGLIADYIADYNNWIFDDPNSYSGFEVTMGVIGYYLQLYCDFSGYSDLSIGLAALLGIRLLQNFNFPYKAKNASEFWHRWHISLSTWFRDYVYIPLGGNRKGKVRTYVNNFITMVVAGLWHGASWMFVIWGLMAAHHAHRHGGLGVLQGEGYGHCGRCLQQDVHRLRLGLPATFRHCQNDVACLCRVGAHHPLGHERVVERTHQGKDDQCALDCQTHRFCSDGAARHQFQPGQRTAAPLRSVLRNEYLWRCRMMNKRFITKRFGCSV